MPESETSEPASRFASEAAWTVIALANAALFALIPLSPGEFVYDEGWYLETVDLFARHGFSREFVAALPGPAGPTYTWVYAAVDAFFGVSFPWLRLTSALLLLASAVLIAASLYEWQRWKAHAYAVSSWLLGATLTALPMVAVSAGMALTEVPALFFLCLFLYFAIRVISREDSGQATNLLPAVLGGVCLGLAILGRQNYLMVLVCLPLLTPRREGSVIASLGLAGLLAAAVAAPVFLIWGGLVPAGVSRVSAGYSPWHFLLGCAYASIAAFLLAPGLFRPLIARPALGIGVAAFGAGLAPLAGFNFLPMRPFFVALFGEASAAPIGSLAAIGLTILALGFLLAFGLHVLRNLDDAIARFGAAALVLGLLSVGAISHVFSSRYTLVFFPFLVLALAKEVRPSWHLPLRLAAGAALGLISLARYFELL